MKDNNKKDSAAIRKDISEVKNEIASLNGKVDAILNSVAVVSQETANLEKEVTADLASINTKVAEVSNFLFVLHEETFNMKKGLETVKISIEKAQESEIPMPRKIGIFWDAQNVRIPKRCMYYPGRLLNFIRNFFCEPGYEITEYCAVMDFDEEIPKLKNIFSEFLSAIHVNGKVKDTEDKKIVELMRQYRKNAGPNCTVVLLTGDNMFHTVVEELKQDKVEVVLVHMENCGTDLRRKASKAISFNSILNALDDIRMTDQEIEMYGGSSDLECDAYDNQVTETPAATDSSESLIVKREREESQARLTQDISATKRVRLSSSLRVEPGPSSSPSAYFIRPNESVQVISKRVEILINWEDFLYKHMILCDSDEYDEKKNNTGYINMGTVVNNMNADIVHPKISGDKICGCDLFMIQYKEGRGIERLREELAIMMTKILKSHEPIDPDNLYCTVGVTSLIDVLTHCIADPGDVIMTPTPVYGRIHTDMLQRALVKMWPIPVISEDNEEDQPRLTLDKVKESYLKAVQSKENVRGIMLLNPNNPLGEVYTPELMKSILGFCYEYQLHAIIDEVYALSVFDEEANFKSVLAFEQVPDPERTHVLYGLSKDFTLTGLRIGVIHSKCKDLRNCLIQLSPFQNITFPVMGIAAKFLEDLEWCKSYAQTNQSRLCEKFNFCKERLMEMNLPIWDSKAGFFLWVNLRKRCNISTFEEEMTFFQYLIKSFHLYIVPGKELFCAQPGWFRISFPGSPDHVVAGLDRLELALEGKEMFS